MSGVHDYLDTFLSDYPRFFLYLCNYWFFQIISLAFTKHIYIQVIETESKWSKNQFVNLKERSIPIIKYFKKH